MKPDTISFWENLLSVRISHPIARLKSNNGTQEQLVDRDPRRTAPLVKWILSLPQEFHGDSAFASTSFYPC